MYTLEFDEDWRTYYKKVPPDIQKRFKKRLNKYEIFPTISFRHAKYGVEFFMDEIGQYRVCFVSNENSKIRRFYFIGKHKEYEKFIGIRK